MNQGTSSLPSVLVHRGRELYLSSQSIDDEGHIDAEWIAPETTGAAASEFSVQARSVEHAYSLIKQAGLQVSDE